MSMGSGPDTGVAFGAEGVMVAVGLTVVAVAATGVYVANAAGGEEASNAIDASSASTSIFSNAATPSSMSTSRSLMRDRSGGAGTGCAANRSPGPPNNAPGKHRVGLIRRIVAQIAQLILRKLLARQQQ